MEERVAKDVLDRMRNLETETIGLETQLATLSLLLRAKKETLSLLQENVKLRYGMQPGDQLLVDGTIQRKTVTASPPARHLTLEGAPPREAVDQAE